MKQNKYSILPAIIEALIILTTSMLTLLLREVPGMMTYIIPITLLAVYILLKFFYRKGTSWIHRHATSKGSVANLSTEIERFDHPLGKAEVQKKRMELFHHEFQLEQQSYLLQKEKENDLKLAAILKYTRDTFKRLDFDETEIFQICECVRYFVTNQQVLNQTEVHIKRRMNVTQIALKNFAWNIAFQYNISGDHAARFVIATLNGSAIRHSLQCGRTYAPQPESMLLRLTNTFCNFAVKRKNDSPRLSTYHPVHSGKKSKCGSSRFSCGNTTAFFDRHKYFTLG